MRWRRVRICGIAGGSMQRPPSPYLVLAAAILLPGCGHVLAGQPQRGLGFLLFTLMLGTVTWHLSTPETSLIGRWAGGLFIYALSIPDAYRIARVNYEAWRRTNGAPSAAGTLEQRNERERR